MTQASVGASALTAGTTRADGFNSPLVPAAVRQVVEVVGQLRDGPVEVRLHPEELGRVRMILQNVEGALVLHVSADRSDTLELLRRHASELQRDLAEAGFGSVDIGFGNTSGDGTGSQSTVSSDTIDATRDMPDMDPDTFRHPANAPGTPRGGLDRRV
ncbi:Flagellar hook-length control protein FliK [Roseivivax jejudonensis]|uniref:Flagellar hook-length control protein FliK n=2 Tax=Roseivivax jejudonensis TaxID=1529041 RepID=A0A1X6YJ00_9RHOB|nr:Flagellar hook-length control protein FliK [Roseivivax jejudonensis]